MPELSKKSKITLSDFNPKRIATLAPEHKTLALGALIGRSVDTVKRQSPDKSQTFTGLSGDFEAYFYPYVDASGVSVTPDPWSSGVLFMPDSFMTSIIELISDKVNPDTGEVLEQGAEAVQFAFEVGVQRAGNPQGYEWYLKPLNERPEAERATDKLAAMRNVLAISKSPAAALLPKPAATEETKQPEPAPANGGKGNRK